MEPKDTIIITTTVEKENKNKPSEEGKILEMESGKVFMRGQYGLRLLSSFLCFASLMVMITSHQTLDFGGFSIKARYNYSTAFVFLAAVDGVVFGCSLLSMLYLFSVIRTKPHPDFCFKLFLHDLAMLFFMTAGCAAGSAIGYVGQYGQNESGWSAICMEVGKFCHKITISVLLSYIALICYLCLTVMTVHKIKPSCSDTEIVTKQ